MRAAAVIALGLALRLSVIALGPGLPYDIGLFQEWAARMAAGGPAGFYDPSRFADYPPGLPILLWPVGVLFGTVPPLAVRLLSIPFDLAIVAAVMWIVARTRPARAWLAAGLAYALNPALAIAGPYWGQLDAVASLLALLAIVATSRRRFAAAGVLTALAVLAKPQAAVVAAPLALVTLAELVRRRDVRPLASWAVSGAVTAAGPRIPFGPA